MSASGLTTAYFSSGAGAPSTAPSVASGEYAIYQNTSNGDLYQWNLSGTPGWTMIYNHAGGSGLSVTTKGDLQGYDTAANRIPVGSNGQVLTADSTQSLGLKWAAGGAGAMTQIAQLTPTGATADFSSIPGTYNNLLFLFQVRTTSGDTPTMYFILNNDTGSNYDRTAYAAYSGAGTSYPTAAQVSGYASFYVAGSSQTANSPTSGDFLLPAYAGTTFRKQAIGRSYVKAADASFQYSIHSMNEWRSTVAVTRVTFSLSAGNFASGSVITLYGIN